ncbi:MAG: murein biosynthesis integral membrane protein MurJ, partial [Propionibacteriaceae bacterium]|nr:murein biosynthesis integral membrane protein MurJ [Propionibacteriaceae bacterium]
DMFSAASEIPSTIYLLLLGGVLNAVIVPQLMRAMSRDADGGQAYSDRIVTLFSGLLVIVTALLMIGTPVVMGVMINSAWRRPEMAAHYHSLLILGVLCMPQVFFYGIFWLLSQILNARGSFGPTMWAPVLNNVIQILMLGTYAVVWGFHSNTSQPFSSAQIGLLGIGTAAGVACQAAILVPYLRKVGFKYRPRFDFFHTGLAATARMAKWALAFVAVDQLLYIVITRLASSATAAGHGAGVYVFNTAVLISQVPHGLLTVSLVTALMPSLSKLSAIGAWDRYTDQLMSNLRLIYAVIVPISVLMVIVGVPIGLVAYGRGAGGSYVGLTVAILAVSLIAFTLRFMTSKAFNAMANTRTPFFVEVGFVAVASVVATILVALFKVPTVWVAPSIAIAYTAAYILSAGWSWILLRRAVPGLKTPLAGFTGRLVLLSFPGAAVGGGISWLQTVLFPGRVLGLIGLVIAGCAGVGVYWGLAKMTNLPEIQDLEIMIRSMLRKEKKVESDQPNTPDTASGPQPDPQDIPTQIIRYLPPFGAEEAQPVLTGLTPLVPGVLMAERYRLGSLTGKIGTGSRWTGVDESLSRPVIVTCFPNDENTMTVLEAARVASAAMDARFLRILDAGQDADQAYIVSEWTEGHTLTEILRSGPLTGTQSAWVVREVASVLASIHAMHLYHCRLDPTKVMISPTGGVKIAGLRVDQALTPRETDAQMSRTDMEALDVVACGALLYACLTATWPGATDIGLQAAPLTADGLQSPMTIRPGTPGPLDRLTRQILSIRDPDHIATAQGITEALTAFIGTKDPTPALAERATGSLQPQTRIVPPAPTGPVQRPRIVPAVTTAPASTASAAAGSATAETEAVTMAVDLGSSGVKTDSEITGHLEHSEPSQPASPLTHPIHPDKARWWSRIFLVLAILVVLALVTALIVGLYNSSHPSSTTTAHAPAVRPISSAMVFDPKDDGGDATENDDLVSLAYDGDPSTAWRTERYPTETYIPEYKPGVGLVFDLGSPVSVSQVSITTDLTPTAVTIYVPSGDASTVKDPDMMTIKNWTSMTSANLTTAETTLSFTQTTTQFVVVYFTQVASVNGVFQSDLSEVSFTG